MSLRPGSLAFNARLRRLSTPLLTPFNSTPTFARMERSRDDLTALEDSRELADGVGVGVGAGGGGGGGGDVEMADAGAEPTEMREHDAIKVKMSAGGKKGKK